MTNTVLFLCYPGELEEKLVLTSSFAWIAFRSGEVLQDYVSVDAEPVLVHDRLKGVDNPDFFLLCVSDLFNRAGVNRSKVTLKQLAKHPEAEVTLNQYLLDFVLFSDEGELFKVDLAVTAPKAARGKEEEVTVQVGNNCVSQLVGAASRRVNRKDHSGVFKKLIPNLRWLKEKVTVKAH